MKLLLLLAFLLQQPSDEEIRSLAARVTDYPTKFRLAAIGAPAIPALFDRLSSSDDWVLFEAKSALRWIVNYAGDRAGIVERLHPFTKPDRSVEARRFAAELLADNGHPSAVEPLAALLGDEGARGAALDALRRIPGGAATTALVRTLADAPADSKKNLLLAIGGRRDPTATRVLLEAAKDAATRDAALEALGEAGDPAAAEALVQAAKEGSAVAHTSLRKLRRGDLAYRCAKTDEQRAEALAVCDDRAIVEEALGREGVREAALAALLRLVEAGKGRGEEDLLRVLRDSRGEALLVRALTDLGHSRTAKIEAVRPFLDHESDRVRAAAVSALRRHPMPEATAALLAAPPSVLVAEALGDRRDPVAIPALARLAKNEDSSLRHAAIRALGEMGERAAANFLEEAARGGEEGALEAFLSVAGRCGDEGLFLRALDLGGGPRALEGLARFGTVAAAAKVEGELERHREEAIACIVAIADRAPRDEALPLYKRAADLGAPGLEEKLRALGERIDFPARDGRVTHWWVIGPFEAPDRESWTLAEPPEREIDLGKSHGGLRWKPCEGRGENAVVDLDALFEKKDRAFAYATAEVVLRRERAAVLRCGSDDGIVVWLNGEKVHEFLEPRGFKPDEDQVPVQLREGPNTILVKVTEISGGWAFHLRLTDEEGRELRFRIR